MNWCATLHDNPAHQGTVMGHALYLYLISFHISIMMNKVLQQHPVVNNNIIIRRRQLYVRESAVYHTKSTCALSTMRNASLHRSKRIRWVVSAQCAMVAVLGTSHNTRGNDHSN
jgi:hypothetical protein